MARTWRLADQAKRLPEFQGAVRNVNSDGDGGARAGGVGVAAGRRCRRRLGCGTDGSAVARTSKLLHE